MTRLMTEELIGQVATLKDPMLPTGTFGVSECTPLISTLSGVRKSLAIGQTTQHTVPLKPTQIPLQTGQSFNFNHATRSVTVIEDCVIMDIINRQSFDATGASVVTGMTVIVRQHDDMHHVYHLTATGLNKNFYDFRYEWNTPLLYRGNQLKRGDILAKTPGYNEDTGFSPGRASWVAYIDALSSCNDAGTISDRASVEHAYASTMQVTLDIGDGVLPKNAYGNKQWFQPIPLQGQAIRPDGVIFATFEAKEELAPIQLTDRYLRNIDAGDMVFRAPAAKYRVIDIQLEMNPEGRSDGIPIEMMGWLRPLIAGNRQRTKEAMSLMARIRDIPEEYLSNELHLYLRTMYGIACASNGSARGLSDKKAKMPPYRLTITIEAVKHMVPGSKWLDPAGSKVTTSCVVPLGKMWRDGNGRIADFVAEGSSTTKRLGPLREGLIYFIDCIITTQERILAKLGLTRLFGTKAQAMSFVSSLCNTNPALYNEVLGMLLVLYKEMTTQYSYVISCLTEDELIEHVAESLWLGVVVIRPNDETIKMLDAVSSLEKKVAPLFDYLYIMDDDGKWQRTATKGRISQTLIIQVDKQAVTARSAVGIPFMNAIGMPTAPDQQRKHSSPCPNTPGRFFGNSETAIVACQMLGSDIPTLRQQATIWSNESALQRYVDLIMGSPNPMQLSTLDLTKDEIPAAMQIMKDDFASLGFALVRPPAKHT